MGKERFGLLTIIWMGVGYFSLFDMGLGRALTKLVAERLGNGEDDQLRPLIWTALWIIFGLGAIGSLILFFGAGPLIHHVLNVQKSLEQEAITAFRVLAIGIPFVVVTTALKGLLEAHQRFALIMAIRTPLGILTFLGPLATLQFSPSLVWATVVLLAARILASAAHFLVAARIQKELTQPDLPEQAHLKPLFRFGGWLTITNIVGPLMVYFDRFLLGAILTMTAVTYYVTPYEVLARTQLLSTSVMSVLFPAMSTAIAYDHLRLAHLYERTTRVLMVIMVPVASAFFLFAPEALELWLDEEFRRESTLVVQWLALGWLINTMAKAPFTVLQSNGRPDLVAKAHIAELIPYGVLLWGLTSQYGIAGTAAAWCARVLVDTLILNELARRTIPALSRTIARTYFELFTVLVGAGLMWTAVTLTGRGIIFVSIIAIMAVPAFHIGKALFRSGVSKAGALS